jgi:hypothetical protein
LLMGSRYGDKKRCATLVKPCLPICLHKTRGKQY